jgi:myosin heavy subunit
MAFVELADDLATLAKLDEQTMVEMLHRRYDEDKIYVRDNEKKPKKKGGK